MLLACLARTPAVLQRVALLADEALGRAMCHCRDIEFENF